MKKSRCFYRVYRDDESGWICTMPHAVSVFAVNFRVLQTLVAGVESARVASVVGWDNYQTSKPANGLL